MKHSHARNVLCLIAAITSLAAIRAKAAEVIWNDENIPHTGQMLAGSEKLAEVDQMVRDIMFKHQVPGATVVITHDGKLIFARGYGWADIENRQVMEPETREVLASVSKSIETVTAMKLIQDGRLKLDDRVFDLLGTKSPPGTTPDPKLKKITVRMLMHHAGGWDRNKGGDPFEFNSKVARELKAKQPVTVEQMIYYMNGRPVEFEPGTKEIYSNYGFMVLGQVIAHATVEPNEPSVQKITFEPMGVRNMQMAAPRMPKHHWEYLPNEAHRYFIGHWKSLPGGHFEATGAAGGWCGSAVSMARFLTALDGTRTGEPFINEKLMTDMLARPQPPLKIRPNGSWFGLGWDSVRELPDWPHGKGLAYGKDGGVNGVSTWIEHLPGGIDWVVLFNGTVSDDDDPSEHHKSKEKSSKPDDKSKSKPSDRAPVSKTGTASDKSPDKPIDRPLTAPVDKAIHPMVNYDQQSALRDIRPKMIDLLRAVKEWPKGDLFPQYP